jgi:hypothetical protein
VGMRGGARRFGTDAVAALDASLWVGVVREAGFEPTTPGFGGLYSIRLSYSRDTGSRGFYRGVGARQQALS